MAFKSRLFYLVRFSLSHDSISLLRGEFLSHVPRGVIAPSRYMTESPKYLYNAWSSLPVSRKTLLRTLKIKSLSHPVVPYPAVHFCLIPGITSLDFRDSKQVRNTCERYILVLEEKDNQSLSPSHQPWGCLAPCAC